MSDNCYQVIRYFRSGFKPQLKADNLTLEQARELCRQNNSVKSQDELPRLWFDCCQKKGIF